MTLLTPNEFAHLHKLDVHPMVHELLAMDSRIRLPKLFGDVDENKGFFVTKETIYIPYILPAIQHDIAHMLEINDHNRCLIPDWGMPRFDGKISVRPFFAALAREVRTRAIQTHITVFASEEEKAQSTAYDQFNNSYWKELAEELLPFGRFKNSQDLTSWMAMLRERTHKAWNLDRIHSEWRTRLTCIQNWMETNN